MIITSLRDEITAALKRQAPQLELLAIVSEHKARGVGQQDTYDTLKSIWVEVGCDVDGDEPSPYCAFLEDIMDRVWGFCPQTDALWDSSLSGVRGT